MSIQTSAFSIATHIFQNVRSLTLNSHEIKSPIVAEINRVTSKLFRQLDRSDPFQTELSRRLWVLRSTILFTLLPFDDVLLNLRQQAKDLTQASSGLPDAEPLIKALVDLVEEILIHSNNPKGEWVSRITTDLEKGHSQNIGLLCALAGGRAPGWPVKESSMLKILGEKFHLISSRKEWRSGVFERMILPCSCRNVSADFLSDIIYSGRTKVLDVLLYPGESLRYVNRIALPTNNVFAARIQESVIQKKDISSLEEESAIDTWADEAFWQDVHGAERVTSKDLIAANYILFCDGTGAFLPSKGRVESLPPDGGIFDARDLTLRRVEDVKEGDFVVLRSGASGISLDAASDRIIAGSGDANVFAEATDWKEALEALLITHSFEEVARALRSRGVSASAVSILQWSGPDVLGPGKEDVFKELIGLLAEEGKISVSNEDLPHYIESRWSNLQSLRGIRHKAGNAIRQNLFEALFKEFGKKNHQMLDRESVHLGDGSNVELLVLRVSAVDKNPAYVPPSRLGQIDDLKDKKWLG